MVTPLMIAHRTPAERSGCEALVAAGANVFEVDVMLAADDEIVLSHDIPFLTGLPWFRHDAWRFSFSRHPAGPPLEAVAELLPPHVEILLDLKCDRGTEAFRLVRKLLTLGLDPARCHASSKNWRSLEELEREGFRTWRSVASPWALRSLLEDDAAPGHAVTVRHPYLTPDTIDRLHRLGRVMAWTVNDPQRALELVAAGVDGVTSDLPEVFTAMAAAAPRVIDVREADPQVGRTTG
ncbi:glycerophosphodiester phosphodiesterase [Kineosporia sp. J2-2]|uniref:Glycerophosphodiester phosphodiesterase n=1 Tax=Kineosporia corallincola TaxID=2835133 RepID=A0ABS5TSN2_9ACTN|nr:glycerophosphodiester phosphodiesterase [Kineosporia corallincola]MBT0773832.1 glycerophosphodiester phosphodiesterase [Kineosporia corallincola]